MFPLVTLPRDLIWDRVHGDQELAKDSIARKAAMHYEVDRAQLSHADCPLTASERAAALKAMRKQMARNLCGRPILRGDIATARRHKADAKLGWGEIIASLR
jgi:hypothetical protein